MSMLVAALSSRIGFLFSSLNKSNYKSVVRELSLLAECGTLDSHIFLHNCLEQVNSREGGFQSLQMKHDLVSVIIRNLFRQPNISTLFSEAVRHTPYNDELLADLLKSLKLSLPEQIGAGLALTDAEDINWSQEGYKLSKTKILELCQNPITCTSEAVIYQALVFLYRSEGLSKHMTTFMKCLSVLNPSAPASLLLMPVLCEETTVINCVRDADNSLAVSKDLMEQLDNSIEAANFLEELGYSCTIDVPHCSEILSLFSPLNINAIARIIGMVLRTRSGLEDSHGIHATFNTVFYNNTFGDGSCLTTWNIDVLLISVKEMVPSVKWKSVVENLDHEGFYLPDEESFNLLMSIYRKACEEPFPIEVVCGDVWKNREGQLSLLKHAALVSPEVFTLAESPIQQMLLEDQQRIFTGNQNQVWLSLDLLNTLFKLADMGHTNSVRSILEYPQKHFPETLILGISQTNITGTSLQFEIFSSLFVIYINGHQHSTIVLHHLWAQNPDIMMQGMVELHSKDATSILKILEVCQDLKALPTVLEATPFSFSIEIASSASRREYLNFENWLHENLSIYRDIFFQACLKFLRERALAEPHTDMPSSSREQGAQMSSLPLETTATVFKVLQLNSSLVISRDLLEEMKRAHAAAVRINPRLLSVGASEQSSEIFATDVEEEANSYFQRIYVGQLTIENVVAMLERFKESPVKREQDIFACMIQCLFDEYRFFPRYPERELKITAMLFGSLIKHQLVSSLTLGAALRYVLDALRKPLDSKMFLFGLTALGKFLDRLVEWPQYCNHILQISHIREAHGDLVDFIEHALARISASQFEQCSVTVEQNHNATGQLLPLNNPPSAEIVEASDGLLKSVLGNTDSVQQQQQHAQTSILDLNEERPKSEMGPLLSLKSSSFVQSSPLQHSPSQLLDSGSGQKDKLGVGQANQGNATSINSNFIRSSRLPGTSRQPTSVTGFGHALNIETLIAAAERRVVPIEAPSSEAQDKVAFIINNISTANTDVKAREFLEVLKEQYYPWFAQYMVMKRASIEPNFHESYLKFLDKINSKALHKEIIKASYENCKVLLGSELIKSSSEERSLLKNLGSWLGKLTIGRNQALRAREIDPKLLITEAYERGLMIAVIPFTSKVLEPCQSSLAYQPPNPWTMGILGLLTEIYALPNLKMNLKFDIEVLFKNLSVDMKDVKPTQLLKGRSREVEGNPDFSNKDLVMSHQSLAATATESNSASMSQVDSFSEASVSPTRSATVHSSQVLQRLVPTLNISSGLSQSEDEKAALIPASERIMAGQGLSQSTPSPSAYSNTQLSMVIPNLSTYVVINSKLATLGQQFQLSRIVPLAMEQAIREIISPVVDRSVTIACMTTRELVTKDYAMEADENRIRHSANLMVASLAGSLAHVTCKEPLRLAMANHIKNLLQALSISGDVLEQAVLLVTNDNLDLGCAVIEKAATEKALRDLEDAIGSALAVRRKQREAVGAGLYDATVYNQENLARLPEQLRPKPGRLSNSQQRVYEDFARLPWQNQPTQSTSAQTVPLSGTLSIPLVSGLGRMCYTPLMGQGLGSYPASGGSQSAMGIGQMAQQVDVSLHDFDDRLTSPLSLTSTGGSAAFGDSSTRQMLESAMGLGNFSVVGRGTIEAGNSDISVTAKDGVILTTPVSPPLPSEHLVASSAEPLLSTVEVMEKYHALIQKLDVALSKCISLGYTSLSQDKEVEALVLEIPEILTQCVTKEEAAVSIAQIEFTRLYEDSSSSLHTSTHLAILSGIRDICRHIVKDLTSLVIFSEEEKMLNRDVVLGLIRYGLIHLADISLHLVKLMDGGRNTSVVEFAVYIVKACVVQDAGVNAADLYSVVDALGKVAQRPGSPESLQKLMEIAKNSSLSASIQAAGVKDDKSKQLREKREQPANNSGVTREDSKLANRDSSSVDAVAFREQVAVLFDEWAHICDGPGVNEKGYDAVYMSQLQQSGMLKGDDISDHFFRVLTEIAVSHALNSETSVPGSITVTALQPGMTFTAIDIYARLVVLLVKYYAVDVSMSKVNLLNRVLAVTVRVMQRESDEKRASFHPRPYFRLFVTWLSEFTSPDPALDGSNFQVLTAFASAFMQLQPLRVPGWSFAWLELVSHRTFMPKVLLSNAQKGWPLMQRLLVALFKFMEPYLRNADLSDPVRLLYKGTLRVLLVLLHDFPEFLCDYHFSFCDVIPPSCIQMRNLILSAFPRNMRLPDPFTPNLKVDLLPEISQSPRILSEVEVSLKNKQLKSEVDDYLKTRQPLSLVLVDLKQWLLLPQHDAVSAGIRYNAPLINSLVLYVGMQAIQQLQSKTSQQLVVPTTPITHSAPMDIFQKLIVELDTEGRYLFLNAIANQLRYPNNHTHYFSCVLLYLFAEANQEIIQEQITRVLLERLIVNRPHPWGLLITFIELIKNPRYNFWSHGFTRCAPEIEKLFESVARSCMGPPLKTTEDDLTSPEGLKS